MKKRIFISLSLLSAFSVVLGALFIVSETKSKRRERAIYERAYAQASEACEGLSLSLFAANMSFSASDISSVSERASTFAQKLSELSLDEERCAPLYRYLSLADDIANTALKQIDSSGDGEYYKNLFGTFAPYAKRVEDEFLPTIKEGADYSVLDDIFADLGGIYYEGAYSDEDREDQFSLLKNGSILQKDEVMGTVEKLMGKNVKLKSSLVQSFPPFYSFYCENASLDISQMGGYVLRFLYDRRPSGEECTPELAKERMVEFMEKLGFCEMKMTEFSDEGDYLAVFVADTDLPAEKIKICVGRDSGKVTAYDATEYYRHRKAESNLKIY